MPNQRGESHLPIILALFFGVAVALLIFGYMFWPKDKEIFTNTTLNTNRTINTNQGTTSAVPAPGFENVNETVVVNGNTNASEEAAKESTDVIDPSNPNVHIYTSYKLGIRFRYWSSGDMKNGVLEQGQRVYVYAIPEKGEAKPTDGQWVEVFSKSPNQSLIEAINEDFLGGIDPSKCYAKVSPYDKDKDPDDSAAVIDFPHSGGLDDPTWGNRKYCPSDYTVTNGILYFWTDDKQGSYVFFSIGQYYIPGVNKNTPWQESFEFI